MKLKKLPPQPELSQILREKVIGQQHRYAVKFDISHATLSQILNQKTGKRGLNLGTKKKLLRLLNSK